MQSGTGWQIRSLFLSPDRIQPQSYNLDGWGAGQSMFHFFCLLSTQLTLKTPLHASHMFPGSVMVTVTYAKQECAYS